MRSEKPLHDLFEEVARDPQLAKAVASDPDPQLAGRGLTDAQIAALKSLDGDQIATELRKEAGPDAAGFSPTITVKVVIKF